MPSEKTKMLNGEPYDPDDPELVADHARARRLTDLYDRTTAHDGTIRNTILAELFGTTGDEIEVEPPFRCDYGAHITSATASTPTSAVSSSTSAGSSSGAIACSVPAFTSTRRPTHWHPNRVAKVSSPASQ
jgi:hypothetical protein